MDESTIPPKRLDNKKNADIESPESDETNPIHAAIARLSFTGPPPPRPQLRWQDRLGMLGNDPVMDSIWEEGRRIREAEREEAPYSDDDDLPLDTEDV